MKLPPLTTLCLAIVIINTQPTFALEALEDEVLSEVTGEGVAFLPENVGMIFRGGDVSTETTAALLTDRTKDTGYLRYIPVGPLTSDAVAAGASKGDVFLYGLAVSRGDDNFNSRLSATDPLITSWGTSDNPWLFKVQTQANVPDFVAATPTATSSGSVTYLSLETPLYHQVLPTTRATGLDAYNLKLALWADAFVRNPAVVENLTATGTQFDVGGANRANRLRLQAIWDGFSINGSDIKMFQTLAGAATGTQGMDSFYNNTLGLTGVLRFNSGDTQNLRALVTTGSATRSTTAWTLDTAYGCGNNSLAFSTAACQFRFQKRTHTDSVSNLGWTPPSATSMLRLSTRETTATGNLLTPAINGGGAPTFEGTEGLFLYSPNINLVLGQLYQPLTLGVAADGKNLVLEVARIANKESIYKQIYTNYDNYNTATNGGYLGSTCNTHQCGTTRTLGGVNYQGNTATHSSISIGSTSYNAATNSLTAYSGAEAVGVSFGQPQSQFLAGPFTTVRTEIEYQQRQARSRAQIFTDTYLVRDDGLGQEEDPFGHPSGDCDGGGLLNAGSANCRRFINRAAELHYDWQYLSSVDVSGFKTFANTVGAYTTLELFGTPATPNPAGGSTGTTNAPPAPFVRGILDCPAGIAITNTNGCNGESGAGGNDGSYGIGVTSIATPTAIRDWDLAGRGLVWRAVIAGTQEASVYGQASNVIPVSPTVSVNPSGLNNLGSAVIDGLLIQHLKITTKGL